MKRADHNCPACEKIIEPDAAVSFQHGDLLHRSCYDALTAAKRPAKAAAPTTRDDSRREESQQA